MLDLKTIRDDPERVALALSVRGIGDAPQLVQQLLELDSVRREALTEVNGLKARRNEVSKEVGALKRAGENADDLIAEMRSVGDRIDALDTQSATADAAIHEHLLQIPNLPDDSVPAGGEDANEVLRAWGEPCTLPFEAKAHWELGEALDILDLPRGSKVSGSGFPVLKGKGARLQRGLIDWMLDLHTQEHGYTELRLPYLVTTDSMVGTGQLPKFSEESYLSERDDLWLIPTAEVPITNLHRDELLDADDLPIRYTGYTPCFRREAGAAGKDTRGLLRVHQFDKVELVRYERPENSREALEELTLEAACVLERLGLAHRVVRLAGGDLGFSAALTYDLEVWAPGVEQWLEVSSASTFTDYQARRANLRFRRAQGERPEYVHTLNASALALPRLMVALLETYQQPDGSVLLPEVLHPRLGFERIGPAGGD